MQLKTMPKIAEGKCPVCRWSVHSWNAKVIEQDVPALIAEFETIGEDPNKFEAFVNAKESEYALHALAN